jgi:hypothetical protein
VRGGRRLGKRGEEKRDEIRGHKLTEYRHARQMGYGGSEGRGQVGRTGVVKVGKRMGSYRLGCGDMVSSCS